MTNQASEDILIELATKFDMDEYGTVNENGGYLIGEVRKLIRTEKLKAQIAILQEGISESKEFCGEDVDINLGWVNFKLNKLQQSLTKLEAEL